MPSFVEAIDPDELATLETRQLLALRNKLLACEESLDVSDMYPLEVEAKVICFKDDPRWSRLYEATKAELSTREHVTTDNKKSRQERAKAQRTYERGRGK